MRVRYPSQLLGAGRHGSIHPAHHSDSAFNAATSMDPHCAECSMKPFSGQGAPRYLSTDNDPLFEFHRWKANLRILDVDKIKTVPHVPISHPFVERLIGTARREFLDHVLFWNTRDLKRKLSEFRAYYNVERVHSSLDGNTPLGVTVGESVKCAELHDVRWRTYCRGLVQLPMVAA